MKTSQRLYRITIIVLLAAISLGAPGCKSSKKKAEAAAAASKMEQEAAKRKQAEELAQSQREAEERASAERAARERDAEEKAKRDAEMNAPASQKLEQYFASIAGSGSVTGANSSINEALTLFSSDQAPVLIIISEEGGQKDYDKPTTIRAYLNYLKDQRKNMNRIGAIQLDANGKIKELELVKQFEQPKK